MYTTCVVAVLLFHAQYGLTRQGLQNEISDITEASPYMSIHKACGAMPLLRLYGINYPATNLDTDCSFFNITHLNSTHVEYEKRSASDNRWIAKYYGVFYSSHALNDGLRMHSSASFDSVTVKNTPDSKRGANYTLLYADNRKCSILSVPLSISGGTWNTAGFKCRVLLTPDALEQGIPPDCETAFLQFCGSTQNLVKLFNKNCLTI
uniref:Lipocalin/cytosolic fatty-acid binding domain-containing protein n=1 Tax=Amblyomma maculatum TaxID=34609 RepID=G3MRQ9_AMBMU